MTKTMEEFAKQTIHLTTYFFYDTLSVTSLQFFGMQHRMIDDWKNLKK